MKYMQMCILFLTVLSVHAVVDTRVPLVTVNGETISLRAVEDAALEKEGAAFIEELVHNHLQTVDWSLIDDKEIMVGMPGWQLPRVWLAAKVLQEHGGMVRDELIKLTLIRQALSTHKIVIGDEEKKFVEDYMYRRVLQDLESKGMSAVSFDVYIEQSFDMPLDEWRASAAYEIVVGSFHMIYEHFDIPEQELRDFYKTNLRYYTIAAGRDISVMNWKYQNSEKAPADFAREQKMVRNVMGLWYATVKRDGQSGWNGLWKSFRSHEPSLGRKGWVDKRGRPETKGQGMLPKPVTKVLFSTEIVSDYTVLSPIEHDKGMSLVVVHESREAETPSFESIQERIKRDYLNADLEHWSKRLIQDLMRDANIEYLTGTESMSTLLEQRIQDGNEAVLGQTPKGE